MIKVTGRILKIFPIQIEKNDFTKRIFWLEENEKYKNILQVETWKNDTAILDNFREGEVGTFYIDLKGRMFMGRDGENKITNSLKCWNYEKDGKLYKEI